MWKEFKNFAFKGNAFDLAIGVIIGAAFSRIVTSLVDEVIMPLIGVATGGVDFSNKFWQLAGPEGATTLEKAKEAGATLAYGNFLTVIINFLIVAFILFQLVRISNNMRKAEPPTPEPVLSTSEKLLAEIRDALTAKAPAKRAAKKK